MLVRTISGLLGLAVLLGALWAGLFWVFLVTLAAAILGIREFYRLHPPATSSPESAALSAGQSLPETLDLKIDSEFSPESGALLNDQSDISMAQDPLAGDALEQPLPELKPPPNLASQLPFMPRLSPVETDEAGVEAAAQRKSECSPTPLPVLAGAVWVGAFVVGGAAAEGLLHFWAISLGVLGIGAFVVLLWLIAFYHGPRWPVAIAYLMGGPVYVGFLLAHVLPLAQVGEVLFKLDPLAFDPELGPTVYEVGRNWLLFALLANFATDSGAYFVGRSMGRHRMAPVVSPNKTWEGAVGGFLSAALAGLLLDRVLYLGLGPTAWDGAWTAWNWQPVMIGATVGVVSQCGDLLESLLKRLSRVKDSGILVPGHGGALDRLDSLLITIPVVYYLLMAVLHS